MPQWIGDKTSAEKKTPQEQQAPQIDAAETGLHTNTDRLSSRATESTNESSQHETCNPLATMNGLSSKRTPPPSITRTAAPTLEVSRTPPLNPTGFGGKSEVSANGVGGGVSCSGERGVENRAGGVSEGIAAARRYSSLSTHTQKVLWRSCMCLHSCFCMACTCLSVYSYTHKCVRACMHAHTHTHTRTHTHTHTHNSFTAPTR